MEELIDESKGTVILKAVIDGKIVGSIRYFIENNSCHIGRVIVHKNYQNRGIGTQLLNEVYEQNNNVKRFELFTGSRDEKNLYLYKKHGFKEFKSINTGEDYSLIYLEKTV